MALESSSRRAKGLGGGGGSAPAGFDGPNAVNVRRKKTPPVKTKVVKKAARCGQKENPGTKGKTHPKGFLSL